MYLLGTDLIGSLWGPYSLTYAYEDTIGRVEFIVCAQPLCSFKIYFLSPQNPAHGRSVCNSPQDADLLFLIHSQFNNLHHIENINNALLPSLW